MTSDHPMSSDRLAERTGGLFRTPAARRERQGRLAEEEMRVLGKVRAMAASLRGREQLRRLDRAVTLAGEFGARPSRCLRRLLRLS